MLQLLTGFGLFIKFFTNFDYTKTVMKHKLRYLPLFLLAFLSGCSNNSTDDLVVLNTQQVRYNTQIRQIIESNCIACHQDPPINFAPMRLTTYEDVKNAVLTRGLIDRISRPQGATGMMPSGGTRLPQAVIDQIVQWQNEGFAE